MERVDLEISFFNILLLELNTFIEPIHPIPYFPNNIFVLDLTSVLNSSSIENLIFYLKPFDSSFQLKIRIIDRQRSCRRPLNANSMLFSGDEITYEYGSKRDKLYVIELRYK